MYIFFISALEGRVLESTLSTRGSLESTSGLVTSIGSFVSTDIMGGAGFSAFFDILFVLEKSISKPGIGKPTE